MALLLICYYIETHGSWWTISSGLRPPITLCFCCAGDHACRSRHLVSRETDVPSDDPEHGKRRGRSQRTASQSAPSDFAIVAAISLWGVAFYFCRDGSSGLLFVVFSFIVFQFIRPRYGSVQKLIDRSGSYGRTRDLLKTL